MGDGPSGGAAKPVCARPTGDRVSVLRARVPPTANAAQRTCASGWVVDTGASRHICPRSAARNRIRPHSVSVETANGVVTSAGVATVSVPTLGDMEALVLDDAPRLLSVSMLVRDGYTLHWGPGKCAISRPGQTAIKLRVVDGIPILPHGGDSAGRGTGLRACPAKTRRGRRAGKRHGRKRRKEQDEREADARNQREGSQANTATLPCVSNPSPFACGEFTPVVNVSAVREGVDVQHRQQGHYPLRNDCSARNQAALRSSPHRRRLPHTGVLAIDIAPISTNGPSVLVGATQQPGWTYAEPIRGRSAECLRAPLLRILAQAMERGNVSAVRADREKGFGALEDELLALGIQLSVTQGSDPQANGLAEQAVGQLARMARGVLATYPDATQASLWQSAMVWAAQRLSDSKLPPFGARVLARHPPKAALGKLTARAVPAVYLHKSTRTPGAAHIGLWGEDKVHGHADRRTIRAVLAEDGCWVFPKIGRVETSWRARGVDYGSAIDGDEDRNDGRHEGEYE